MSKYAVQVENLSKSYLIRQAEQARYSSLRDEISGWAGRFFSHLIRCQNPFQSWNIKEEFWALQDISFNVEQGEVLGIIGKNGAGKSTLLKLLSRITEPDKGRIVLNGRVASLLEVGTGFHPELSGRENIYLSGALLGMRREEIRKRFDEIVDFAGVEKFLETPVKRYSSGMYVRLGFAVAAHLETEILLLDEVLAVGDAEFQRKCFKKIGETAKNGITVLLVSHNLSQAHQLCNRGMFLDKGQVVVSGQMSAVLENYTNSLEHVNLLTTSIHVELSKHPLNQYRFDENIEIKIKINKFISNHISLSLTNRFNERILLSERVINIESLPIAIIVKIPKNILMEGRYYVSVNFKDPRTFSFLTLNENIASFDIINRPENYLHYNLQKLGFIIDVLNWQY